MKEYSPITIIVKSANRYRAFTTQQFTIRSFVVIFQRYNPDYKIVDYYEGTCRHSAITNDEWKAVPEYKPVADIMQLTYANCIDAYICEEDSYRNALNRYYLWCSVNNVYAQKHADRTAIKKRIMPELYNEIERNCITAGCLSFLPDSRSPFARKEDVLLYFQGKRYTATRNAEEIEGYVIKLKNDCEDE